VGTTISQGIELSVDGEILPGWNLAFSYTYDDNYNTGSQAISLGGTTFTSQQPLHQGKIWTTYRLPGSIQDWTVGGGFRLESRRYTQGTACTLAYDPSGACTDPVTGNYDAAPFNFTQSLYTVLDLQLGYHIDRHWSATAAVTNVADTRYYETAGTPTGGNFYGPPRAFMLAVHGKF
jgi:outer membrane receptor for ferric coprogen and ferric-rhodotorulic acid